MPSETLQKPRTVPSDGLHPVKQRCELCDDGFQFASPNFVERYLRSHVWILIDFRIRGVNQEWLAYLYKERLDWADFEVGCRLQWFTFPGLPEMLPNIETSHTDAQRYEQPMLVSVIETMQTPERGIPSLVRLCPKDVFNRSNSRASYLSTKGFPLVFGERPRFENRETRVIGGFPPVSFNKGVHEVIKSTPQMLEDFSRPERYIGGHFGNLCGEVDPISSIRVNLSPDSIRVSVDPSIDSLFEVKDALIGPIDL